MVSHGLASRCGLEHHAAQEAQSSEGQEVVSEELRKNLATEVLSIHLYPLSILS
jgi:hypothetical protein